MGWGFGIQKNLSRIQKRSDADPQHQLDATPSHSEVIPMIQKKVYIENKAFL
jgi:hypothetical protein